MKRGRSSSYDMPDGMTLGGMTHTGESVGHMHGMVIGDVPVGPAVDMSAVNSVEYPPSSTEPFGEAETRALIRIRHQMDDVFQSTTKKRGVKDMYVQVAERLYAEGGGEWPQRTNVQVAQKWNNLIGSYKEFLTPRPGSSRSRSFKYEEDMVWFRDQLAADGKRSRSAARMTVEPVALEDGGFVLAPVPKSDVPSPPEYQGAWDEIQALRKDCEPELDALLVQACGYLLHPKKRRPIMDLFQLWHTQGWPRELFNLYFKATMAAYDPVPATASM